MAKTTQKLAIYAPLSGIVVPLDTVPDPVFSQKLVGDGIAIDPISSKVFAPVSGKVTQFHPSCHAFTITTDTGVEVLVHVGLDTVMLRGKGFFPFVMQGDTVQRGQAILRFDPEYLASNARSLLTEVIIANVNKVTHIKPVSGFVKAGENVLITLEVLSDEISSTITSAPCYSDVIRLPNPIGLHARPAAVLANTAKQFDSDIRLIRGQDEINAKSVVAILGLSTVQGDPIQIKAIGPDSQQAMTELSRLITEGCREKLDEVLAVSEDIARSQITTNVATTVPGELSGAAASPGLAVGRIVQFRRDAIQIDPLGGTVEDERARFIEALHTAAEQIDQVKLRLSDPSKIPILEVHQSLLEDPDLLGLADSGLAEGKSAAFAWHTAFSTYATKLEKLENKILSERANDIRDVGQRVLILLAGLKETKIDVPEGSILIAEELTPSDTASLDREKILGFCTTTGGATSHVAILARSMDIPAVCGIDKAALALPNGTQVVIDGTQGFLHVSPDVRYLAQTTERIARQRAKRQRDANATFGPARTMDGHRVEVVANIRNAKDASEAIAAGAEGVGLLRSEFLFDDRDTAPTEDEQAAAYIAVAEILGKDRPFVVRTLDIGGDKPLSYLPLPKEDNPFLGLRGIRVSLAYPEIFRTQLRAILRAAPFGNVHIMFPMVAGIDGVRAARKILEEEQKAFTHTVKLGVMIEVPSAAAIAEVLAREVDFFSIGTNDLTQYTLAMDRGHPQLAKFADALHPAVLKMIAMAVEGAHQHGKWVGVCGGIASDTLAVPVLVGLGIDELSVSIPSIASVKATLSRLSLEKCQSLAKEVLKLGTATEVRAMLVPHVE